MSLLTGDDFEDEEIEHEKVKQAFQQGNFYFQLIFLHDSADIWVRFYITHILF